jgi:hypothetical protein
MSKELIVIFIFTSLAFWIGYLIGRAGKDKEYPNDLNGGCNRLR